MKLSSPAVSILMPVKNAQPFLRDCLQSIITQSYKDWELIAVNDGSTDNSASLLDQYANSDHRITHLSNDGKGIIPALRQALRHSRGHYITRMDADDIMHPDKIKVLVEQLQLKGPGHLAVGQVKYFADNILGEGYQTYERWLNRLTSAGNNFLDIYKECVIPSPCWMVGREDLDKSGAFESDLYPEDYDLCFRFYRHGLSVIPCREVLHHWRDHQTRSSRTDPHYADNRFLELKCHYFVQLDYQSHRPCVLWGAGKKGKVVARLLNQANIQFQWVSNNAKKIGHTIYGVQLDSDLDIKWNASPQIIIAVASQSDQNAIIDMILSHKMTKGRDYFQFC